jgi:hypothetical protein
MRYGFMINNDTNVYVNTLDKFSIEWLAGLNEPMVGFNCAAGGFASAKKGGIRGRSDPDVGRFKRQDEVTGHLQP